MDDISLALVGSDTAPSSTRRRPSRPLARRLAHIALAFVVGATFIVLSEQPAAGASDQDLARVVEVMGSGSNLWVVSATGAVEPIGSAPLLGEGIGSDFTAAVATPTGNGYWLARVNGQVQAFGDAAHLGEFTSLAAGTQIVDMATTSTGQGYWLVASDGGIFTFGDARFFGSTGAMALNRPVIGMAPTPSDNGYWLVASDGGIFTFGDAPYLGSTGGIQLNEPVVGMSSTASGWGYWLVARDGGMFTFGDAPYLGSLGGHWETGIVGIHTTETGGYLMVNSAARIAEFHSSRPNYALGAWTAAAHTAEAALEAELYTRLTAERDARGLPPLLWDARLATGSQDWSVQMSLSGFSHSDVRQVFDHLGTYDSLGENIYRGSIDYADSGSAHLGFMNSAEHRDTLLADRFTTVGIGVLCGPDGQLWVTVRFGVPNGHAPGGSRPPTAVNPVAANNSGGTRC
jgi:uncharacterized protein YkwD